jgi:CTP:molybdopterin cytidylyltransferase MocA
MDEHIDTGGAVANIGAVIVAAGMSSRMGAYKPLLEIGGVTVARRVTGAFAAAGAWPIVVVTGHRAAELEAHLSEYPPGAREESLRAATNAPPHRELLFVTNENYATTSMYESAKIGLSYIAGKCARTFFCPIDVPLFTEATVRRLMTYNAPVIKPVYKGKEGHPILIDVKLIPELTESVSSREPQPDDNERTRNECGSRGGGLKGALAGFERVTTRVDVDDEGILYDADTPGDMKKLTELFSKHDL